MEFTQSTYFTIEGRPRVENITFLLKQDGDPRAHPLWSTGRMRENSPEAAKKFEELLAAKEAWALGGVVYVVAPGQTYQGVQTPKEAKEATLEEKAQIWDKWIWTFRSWVSQDQPDMSKYMVEGPISPQTGKPMIMYNIPPEVTEWWDVSKAPTNKQAVNSDRKQYDELVAALSAPSKDAIAVTKKATGKKGKV